MHGLILGITGCGKTSQGFRLARNYKAINRRRIILDPDKRQKWEIVPEHDFLTDDPELFLAVCQKNINCALFVDESGQMIGHYDKQLFWLATQSRKWGHCAWFISQRAAQISPTIRGQCQRLFLFQQSIMDCKILAVDFNRPELLQATELRKGEYLARLGVDAKVYKGKVW